MENQRTAYATGNSLERTRHYMGGYWVFLAKGTDTNGQFALMEVNLRKGFEPPAHTHTNEDESFHILAGEITFTIDGEEHVLKAGDFIHLPKGVAHSFKLQSDKVKMLAHLIPAGLEEFFMELSIPADKIDYPPLPSGPPDPEWIKKIGALQQKYGIVGMDNSRIKAS